MRTLYRVDAMGHPALPDVLKGDLDRDERVAFTMTRLVGEQVRIDEAVDWSRRNPLPALEQYAMLLDALARLHGTRMLHRNLTLSALRSSSLRQGGTPVVTLSLA